MNTWIENHTFLKETDFFNRNMDIWRSSDAYFINESLVLL